jgi:hypothetical protein
MFPKFLTSLFQRTSLDAKSEVATPNPPKRLPRSQLTTPSYLKTAKPSESNSLPLTDRRLANTDTLTYRNGADTRAIIRDFAAASPDISAAVNAALRTAITDSWTAVAYNMDGTVSPDGTKLLQQIIASMNFLSSYDMGYADRNSLLSTSEAIGKELMLYGSYGVELVLDKTRLPERLQPISTTAIKFYPTDNGKRLKPVQEIAGEKIDLDIPTFFYGSVDQDLLEPYSASPLEPALQPVLFSTDFMNDLRRVVKRAIHPRVTVTIDEEKFRKGIPLEFQNDQEKIAGYMASVVSEIETKVNGLKPEDALIVFDTIGIEVVDHGNTNLSNEWEALQGFANSKLATGTKTMPTILGHGSASANIASAEALLYMKTADGLVRKKLNELYSRVFTLAVRLYGIDCYVEFAYEDIDLRPKNEVEAFKAMKQSRVLELLSLGFMSDEEASIMLTGKLPSANAPQLSGTGFRANTSVSPAGSGYNGATNSGSTTNQNLNPDTPTGGARGGNKKAETGGEDGRNLRVV